jgi:hypothetical protein
MDAVEASVDGAALWLAGGRIDAATLAAEAPLDDVSHVLRDEGDTRRLVWSDDLDALVWIVDGSFGERIAVPAATWGAPALAFGGDGDSAGVALCTFDGAEIRWVPAPAP